MFPILYSEFSHGKLNKILFLFIYYYYFLLLHHVNSTCYSLSETYVGFIIFKLLIPSFYINFWVLSTCFSLTEALLLTGYPLARVSNADVCSLNFRIIKFIEMRYIQSLFKLWEKGCCFIFVGCHTLLRVGTNLKMLIHNLVFLLGQLQR